MSTAWFGVLVACVALQRIVELAISRRHIRAARARHAGRIPAAATGAGAWSAMVALHVALLVLPLAESAWFQPVVPTFVVVIGAVLLAAGQALRFWTLRSLGAAWNARAVVDPELAIVTTGPYRFVRHPNYTAVLLEFVAIPLLGGAWYSLVVLNLVHSVVLAHRIRGEEALLAQLPAWREHIAPKGALIPHRQR